eukprot:TRINITY_DN11961_c0_g1_i1.p1 TRINITY_DN11961_c0_g1~~TRINITY_DN11961_c0_g1_i1.p1  ORF type:complete len:349 (-),score=49.38 TRINITY_DN11961_c0_g1_i1:36-1082(-)
MVVLSLSFQNMATDTGTLIRSSMEMEGSWQSNCERVWSKPLKDLPVAIDLPRLAPNTTIVDLTKTNPEVLGRLNIPCVEAIYDYTSKNSIMSSGDIDLSFEKHQLMRLLENTTDKWVRVEFNGKIGVVPADYVKTVTSPPVSKDKRTLDVLVTLVSLLESQDMTQKVKDSYYKYIPHSVDNNDKDISAELKRFLNEVLGEISPTVRVLKACNQSIIAPAVTQMWKQLNNTMLLRDGVGWHIRIAVSETEVTVTHWKRQKQIPKKQPAPELFEFEWELSLSFDRNVEKITSYSFNLKSITFHESADKNQQDEVKCILNDYFENYGGLKTTPNNSNPASLKTSPLENVSN